MLRKGDKVGILGTMMKYCKVFRGIIDDLKTILKLSHSFLSLTSLVVFVSMPRSPITLRTPSFMGKSHFRPDRTCFGVVVVSVEGGGGWVGADDGSGKLESAGFSAYEK